jgi:putative iron-regulated protein
MASRPSLRVALAALLLACGCQAKPERREPPDDSAFERETLRRYAEIAFEGYSDATEAASRLLSAVADLLEQPSPARLARARAAWLAARTPYLQTETFRFYQYLADR